MDTPGIEPGAFRLQSGRATTALRAHIRAPTQTTFHTHLNTTIMRPSLPPPHTRNNNYTHTKHTPIPTNTTQSTINTHDNKQQTNNTADTTTRNSLHITTHGPNAHQPRHQPPQQRRVRIKKTTHTYTRQGPVCAFFATERERERERRRKEGLIQPGQRWWRRRARRCPKRNEDRLHKALWRMVQKRCMHAETGSWCEEERNGHAGD